MKKRDYIKLLPLTILLLLLFGFGAYAQIAKDSLSLLVEQEVDAQLDEKLKPLKFLLGISVATLSVLGVLMWFYRLKKIANEVVEKRVSTLVEKQIAEKFGVKMKILQHYFQEAEEREQTIMNKRIAVVNKSVGKRISLVKIIEDAGFLVSDTQKLMFITLVKIQETAHRDNNEKVLDEGKFDILLIDNFNGELQEEEITRLINDYHNKLQLVCLTNVDLAGYAELKEKAAIIKKEDRLKQELINAALK